MRTATEAIRAIRFEVLLDKEQWRAIHPKWLSLCHAVKRLVNRIWTCWLLWHTQIKSQETVRDYLAAQRAWHDATQEWQAARNARKKAQQQQRRLKKAGKPQWKEVELPGIPAKPRKPKLELRAVDSQCSNYLYHETAKAFPTLNKRVLVLQLNKETGNIGSKKSAKQNTKRVRSEFPVWLKILGDDGEFPSASRPQPIPFDKVNSIIMPPEGDEKEWWVLLQLARDTESGKTLPDTVRIKTQGRKVASQLAILERLVPRCIPCNRLIPSGGRLAKTCAECGAPMKKLNSKGKTITVEVCPKCKSPARRLCPHCGGPAELPEYAYKGSRLAYDETKNKWFVFFSYQLPIGERVALDPNKNAELRASGIRPLELQLNGDGFTKYIGGNWGRHVRHVRRQLLVQRFSRSGAYKIKSSAGKGHGHNRAHALGMRKLRNRWLDFVKTFNQHAAFDTVRWLVDRQIGNLTYRQPAGDWAKECFLATAGKMEGRHESTSWEWHQLKTFLADKCQEAGIEFSVVPMESGNGEA